LAVQLRRSDGVCRAPFRAQTGFDLDELAGPALQLHTASGLLADDGCRIHLTRQGKYVADSVIESLL
jgi:oxygen-independent coproporphyrinogen-3 oxidase